MAPTSAKSLAKTQLQQVGADDEHEDDFQQDTGLFNNGGATGDSSDEKDDYGKGKKRIRTRASAGKRAKTSSMPVPSKKDESLSKHRQRRSPSLLPTMPLEVLFEIFGLLNPKDIISLTRTSKIFRETLISRGAITVWKAARDRLNAPEPPGDMSEPGWAALLFGNACQNCDAKKAQRIDLKLRRRLCTKCRKSGIVVESGLWKKFPNLDRSILELIPHTDSGERAQASSHDRFFWKEDIKSMIQTVAALEKDMHVGQEDAQVKLEEFRNERKVLVESICSAAHGYQEIEDWAKDWAKDDHRERQMDKDALVERRREAISDRFVQLGYEKQDVRYLRFEAELTSATPLTDRIWERIRPILEPKVQQRQKQRLEVEVATLKGSRRNMVHDLYQTYQRSLVPSQWRFLPRALVICQLEPFAQLIEAPADVVIKLEDFEHGRQLLPELLSSLLEEKQAEFASMLPAAELQDAPELATSVLECHQSSGAHGPCGIVGMEEFLSHHCDSEQRSYSNHHAAWFGDVSAHTSTSSVRFSLRGTKTASMLVQLSGLDPDTALASDMDKNDLRFACCRCKMSNHWTVDGYSWRRAISHDIQYHHPGKTQRESDLEDCRWEILSDTITQELKAKERADSKWKAKLWTCGHCSIFLTDLRSRADIVRHLAAIHAIVGPEEPSDLFMFERFSSDFRQRIMYSFAEPSEFQSSGQAV